MEPPLLCVDVERKRGVRVDFLSQRGGAEQARLCDLLRDVVSPPKFVLLGGQSNTRLEKHWRTKHIRSVGWLTGIAEQERWHSGISTGSIIIPQHLFEMD